MTVFTIGYEGLDIDAFMFNGGQLMISHWSWNRCWLPIRNFRSFASRSSLDQQHISQECLGRGLCCGAIVGAVGLFLFRRMARSCFLARVTSADSRY
jgi:hypothetical protein